MYSGNFSYFPSVCSGCGWRCVRLQQCLDTCQKKYSPYHQLSSWCRDAMSHYVLYITYCIHWQQERLVTRCIRICQITEMQLHPSFVKSYQQFLAHPTTGPSDCSHPPWSWAPGSLTPCCVSPRVTAPQVIVHVGPEGKSLPFPYRHTASDADPGRTPPPCGLAILRDWRHSCESY